MERMWRLLFEDATEGAGNLDPAVVCAPTLPPCWSFAAREGILGDIAGYASIDLPCGMLEYTLGWFERLLTDLACMDVVELLGNTGRRYVAKLQTTAWRPVEQLLIDAGAALEPSEEDVDTMVPFLSLGQSVLDVAADAFSGQTSYCLPGFKVR
ncbi:hypothetical protein BDF19DRAFT_414557 [Syncephalis fuscata]|nr:hypothetical protein BDF19DRAFT_414557 [Syncephalis fuscata]